MSDTNKEEVKEEVNQVVNVNVEKEEVVEQKVEKAEKADKADNTVKETMVSVLKYSPFVSETDTFEIKVKYYRKGVKVFVKEITDGFDDKEECDEIVMKLKYPDQGDLNLISTGLAGAFKDDEIDVSKFTKLETNRMILLIRGWNLEENYESQEAIMKIHSHIIKAALEEIRKELGMDGII